MANVNDKIYRLACELKDELEEQDNTLREIIEQLDKLALIYETGAEDLEEVRR